MEKKRWWMSLGAIAGLIALLVVFKYLEFIFVNIAWLGGAIGFNWQAPVLNIILPIGLSFYVFQKYRPRLRAVRGA